MKKRKEFDLDSFIENHKRSLPKIDHSEVDDRAVARRILNLHEAEEKEMKLNFFRQALLSGRETFSRISDSMIIGGYRVLSPQFGMVTSVIILISAIILMWDTTEEQPSLALITETEQPINNTIAEENLITDDKVSKESQQNITDDDNVEYADNKEQSVDDSESSIPKDEGQAIEEEIETVIIPEESDFVSDDEIEENDFGSLPIEYTDRGKGESKTSFDKRLDIAFTMIQNVLKDHGVSIAKVKSGNVIVTEWLLNKENASKQSRMTFKYNTSTKKIDVKVESQKSKPQTTKKINLTKLYDDIDYEVFQRLQFLK